MYLNNNASEEDLSGGQHVLVAEISLLIMQMSQEIVFQCRNCFRFCFSGSWEISL